MEKASSNGKNAAIAGLAGTQAVTLLLYIVHKFGVDDMTPEVANAIIGVSMVIGGGIYHTLEKLSFERQRKRDNAHNVNGQPGAAAAVVPVAGAGA